MTIKEQFRKLRDNWLLILVVLIIAGAFFVANQPSTKSFQFGENFGLSSPMLSEQAKATSAVYDRTGIYPVPSSNFAPEVTERKITKSANLDSEIERGTFQNAEDKLKAIVTSTNSYLLNQNVQKYGIGKSSYYYGYYSIKVDSTKYAAIVSQLKEIGEVQSFSENAKDVTGQYTDTQVELEAERARLQRYKDMYAEATKIEDKIQLNDRIFDQERKVKYYEEALRNIDQRVDYSTINVQLHEKQSAYINVVWIKFSELVRSLVDSINSLLKLLFVVLPYALVVGVIWWIVKKVRRKK